MSLALVQRRILGGANRILWRSGDLDRIAKHFNYTGSIGEIFSKRDNGRMHVMPDTQIRTESSHEVYRWTISTAAVDHMNDSIFVAGWDLSIHRSNPVVFFGHDSSFLPIGRAIWTGTENGRLKSEMVFASDGFAARTRAAVDDRTLRACSVGFRPGEWEFSKDPKRKGGIDFVRGHVLMEFSLCGLPANPQCLFEGTKGTKSAALPPLVAPPVVSTPFLDRAQARLEKLRRR